MNTNLARYRILKTEEQTLWQKVLDFDHWLAGYVDHPERYDLDMLASLREQKLTARQEIDAITAEIHSLSTDSEVLAELQRSQGITPTTTQPTMRLFSDMEEQRVPWLWYPFLPIGRLTILEGDPGQGKSWFALAIATCVSIGSWLELMPGEENHTEPGGVVYVTSEDDPEDTIKKRLRILQADQRRIAHLSGKSHKGKQAGVNLSDLSVFQEALSQVQAKLLIIDPIQAYLPSGADMNKAEQIRPLLAALQKMASAQKVAVLLVRHLTKGSKDNALYKGMGSIDFTAAARSVLMCAERKDSEQWTEPQAGKAPQLISRRYAVTQVKNNLSARGPAVEFELSRDQFGWIGTTNLTTEQLLNPESRGTQDAKGFLLTLLQQGGMLGSDVTKKAHAAGISTVELSTAKAALNVELHADEKGGAWFLPGKYVAH